MSSSFFSTIPELAAISNREPSIKTVLVEGDEDKRVYRYLLSGQLAADVDFLPIRFVEVPLPESPRPGAGGGNRARVIEAALGLQTAGAKQHQICCIADTDLGFILPKGPDCADFLIYTDATCLEAYYLTASAIDELLKSYCSRDDLKSSDCFSEIEGILRTLMATRIAITELSPPVGWINEPPIEWDKKTKALELNLSQLVLRLLTKANQADQIEKITSRIEEISNVIRSLNSQLVMHGKDFIWVLRKYLRAKGVDQKLLDETVFFKAFSLCGALRTMSLRGTFDSIIAFSKL